MGNEIHGPASPDDILQYLEDPTERPSNPAIDGEATEASIHGAGFSVTLSSGETLVASSFRIRLA